MKLSSRGAHRQVAVALVAVVAGLFIAACGSSSSSSSSTSTNAAATNSTSSSRAKLVACLKSHGVTLPAGAGRLRRGAPGGGPPGGGGGGGGGLFGGGGGGAGGGGGPGGGAAGANRGRFFNSKTAAAFKACGAQFGGGARFRGRGRFQLSHTKITQFVACVRKHGYNLPSPNFSGKGPVFPANIRTNKKFQTASKACASILAPPGGTSTNAAT